MFVLSVTVSEILTVELFSVLAPAIANMTNLSFKEGCFQSGFKTAQILPLLKKPSTDREMFANYRLISNLSTISKMVERLELVRLNLFMTSSPNFNPVQSAYRTAHSAETALIKVFNSVYENVDARESRSSSPLTYQRRSIPSATQNYSTVYVFISVYAAFEWIASNLADHQQYVKIGQHSSTTRKLNSDVPQGSLLGPLLITAYVSPVGDVITLMSLKHHQYAGDT